MSRRQSPPTSPQPRDREPSAAENIKHDLDVYGITKWGWVIYRTDYTTPGSDSSWNQLQEAIASQSAREMSKPNVPREIADGLEWVFTSDSTTLGGLTRYDLRLRFLEWVGKQQAANTRMGVPSRYLFFVHVDEEVMRSAETEGGLPRWVKLVRCDQRDLVCEFVSKEELEECSEELDGDEGWMKVGVGVLGAELYSMLDGQEGWYVYYKVHPEVLEYA